MSVQNSGGSSVENKVGLSGLISESGRHIAKGDSSKSRGRGHRSRKMHLTRRGVQAALIAAMMPVVSRAGNIYWDGTGNNNTTTGWNDVTSWSTVNNAAVPDPTAIPGILDDAIFSINGLATNQTVDLNGSQSAQGLVFIGTPTTTFSNGASASTLTLGSDGILVSSGAGAVSLSSNITGLILGASQSWINNTGNTLTVATSLTNSGNLLTLGGSGAFTLSGVISERGRENHQGGQR